jgi:hypothetical protein
MALVKQSSAAPSMLSRHGARGTSASTLAHGTGDRFEAGGDRFKAGRLSTMVASPYALLHGCKRTPHDAHVLLRNSESTSP